MPFPLDPNAPGGPERSEYVRRSYADGLRDGDVVADPVYATSDLMALLHLRRLEARIIMSVFGA
jgi:hypothetical protein